MQQNVPDVEMVKHIQAVLKPTKVPGLSQGMGPFLASELFPPGGFPCKHTVRVLQTHGTIFMSYIV